MIAKPTRWATAELLVMAEEGMISWETLARDALRYMSEADVEDMGQANGYFEHVEEDEDD